MYLLEVVYIKKGSIMKKLLLNLLVACVAYTTVNADTLTWSKDDQNITQEYLTSVAYSGSQYVIVGNHGIILNTNDAVYAAWNKQYVGSEDLFAVTYGDNKFVAVGREGRILYSTAGGTWAVATKSDTNSSLFDVVYGEGKFVAVGENGTIITSTDGEIWTKQTSGTSDKLEAITYNATTHSFVVPDWSDSYTLHSNDGITWTKESATFSSMVDIASTNSMYLGIYSGAYGNTPTVYTSPDGNNWTFHAINEPNTGYNAIAVSPAHIVAVGGAYHVTPSVGVVVAFNNDNNWSNYDQQIILSDDNNPGTELNDIIYDGKRFVAVGAYGTIVLSSEDNTYPTSPMITKAYLSSLSSGWHLLGATSDIVDMSLFDDMDIVWSYDNSDKKWNAYSMDTSKITNAGYGIIYSISKGSGFWVYKK